MYKRQGSLRWKQGQDQDANSCGQNNIRQHKFEAPHMICLCIVYFILSENSNVNKPEWYNTEACTV